MATAVHSYNEDYTKDANHSEIFSLIWLDANVNVKENRGAETKLTAISNHLQKFQSGQQCEQYIRQRSPTDRLVIIVSGQLGQKFVPSIHHLGQVSSIYVFCKDKTGHEGWACKFVKVKAIVVEIDELIGRLRTDHKIQMKVNEPLSINVFTTGKSTTEVNGQFVFNQVLIDCLLRMEADQIDKNELILHLRNTYEGNNTMLANLHEFQQNYSPDKALWWYTRDSFFYKTLNTALRTQDIDMIFLYRSFISDIHRHLQSNQEKCPLQVYRSQLMSSDELSYLKQNIGQFISVNSFLSTSRQPQIAHFYMGDTTHPIDLERVLFEIDADPTVVTTKPFADIRAQSEFYTEFEVLFMLGSIFRLNSVSHRADQVWIVRMTLCGDDEHDLKEVLTYLKNQNGAGQTDLRTLGNLLSDMGKFDLAEKYYTRLLNQLSLRDPLLISLYEDLGKTASRRGDLNISVQWHERSLAIREQDSNQYQNIQLKQMIAQSEPGSEMNLSGQYLIDRDTDILVKQAIIKRQCKSLLLRQNKLTSVGASIFARALNNNNTLQKLNLRDNNVSDEGAKSLANVLENNNHVLKWLGLQKNGITDSGAEYFAQMLKKNQTLIYLSLSCNNISDRGVQLLVSALNNPNNNLQVLSLSKNTLITDSSFESLCGMIKNHRSLKILRLYGCNLSWKLKKRLQNAAASKAYFDLKL